MLSYLRDKRSLSVAFALFFFFVGNAGLAAGNASLAIDWPQFGMNPQHTSSNPLEITINAGNVANLQMLYKVNLPSPADSTPVYLHSVSTPQGIKNLIFVTTKAGDIVALDADTGTIVWSKQNPAGSCVINKLTIPCYTTSSPAIDPNRQYVYSYGLDGFVHKYQVGDGTEITTGGWPELVTLKNFDEKGSSALTVVTTVTGAHYLYATISGYPNVLDVGDFQGHVTAINLDTGAQNVFNSLCSNQAVHFVDTPGTPDCAQTWAGMWARGPILYVPDSNRIYVATGNGTYDPANHMWGDSILALHPDGTGLNGDPLDTYTPSNYQFLDDKDADLGSGAPVLLPVTPNSKYRHIAVQVGKDAEIKLVNLDNLSGKGGPGNIGGELAPMLPLPQGGQVVTSPAVWVNPADNSTWIFYANANGIASFKLVFDAGGNPSLTVMWSHPGAQGTSPVVANGVLYYAINAEIIALDPVSGQQLWSSTQIGGIHWESPIVANGVVYLTDENGTLTAFSLNGVLPVLPDPSHFIYLPTDLH